MPKKEPKKEQRRVFKPKPRQWCPKCGPGIALAQHANRLSCGKCGYTEFLEKKQLEKKELEKKQLEKGSAKAP